MKFIFIITNKAKLILKGEGTHMPEFINILKEIKIYLFIRIIIIIHLNTK